MIAKSGSESSLSEEGNENKNNENKNNENKNNEDSMKKKKEPDVQIEEKEMCSDEEKEVPVPVVRRRRSSARGNPLVSVLQVNSGNKCDYHNSIQYCEVCVFILMKQANKATFMLYMGFVTYNGVETMTVLVLLLEYTGCV